MAARTPERLENAIHWIGVNALRLRADAELLHRAYRFPSSIFMSISCVEECVKYCVLWHSAKRENALTADLHEHKEKLSLALIFSFRELIVAARDHYLLDESKTRELAASAGLDPEEFLTSIRHIPNTMSEAKAIELFLDTDKDLREFLHTVFTTSDLAKVRKMALYADLGDDGNNLSLSHPMFFNEEVSRSMLRIAGKTCDFIKATSARLAERRDPPLPFLFGFSGAAIDKAPSTGGGA